MSTDRLIAPETGYTYTAAQDIFVLDCPSCGISYGIPRGFRDRRLKDGRNWHCPNGHTVHYPQGESQEDKLKRQLKASREESARKSAALEQAKASARGQKAAKTRYKNKLEEERNLIAAGTCPCCGERRFAGLKEHMEKAHPEYALPENDPTKV